MSKIKIFVCHSPDKNNDFINNKLYQNVVGGAVFAKHIPQSFIGDNTGDNISQLNRDFCELTVQYFVWKNYDLDFYGMCHYRRFLSFADSPVKSECPELDYGSVVRGHVVERHLDDSVISKHHLIDNQVINNAVQSYDAIVSVPFSVVNITPNNKEKTVRGHYSSFDQMFRSIDEGNNLFKLLGEIIEKNYPQYFESYNNYLSSSNGIGYNSFLLKKSYFNEMCEFEFGTLFKFKKIIESSDDYLLKQRIYGFFGEILFGTYLTYLISNKVKVKFIPMAFIAEPERRLPDLSFQNNETAFVSTCSDFSYRHLLVSLQSLVSTTDNTNIFDFYIFYQNLSLSNQKEFYKLGLNIVFVKMDSPFKDNLRFRGDYIKVCLSAPFILNNYHRIIVFDSDIIFNCDFNSLELTRFINTTITAAPWFFKIASINCNPRSFDYYKKKIQIRHPLKMFDSKFLVIDTKRFIEKYSNIDFNSFLSIKDVDDETLLNVIFQDDCNFLPYRFLFQPASTNHEINVAKHAPSIYLYNRMDAIQKPIVCFSGPVKPWDNPSVEEAYIWWKYAKKTNYYEYFICKTSKDIKTQSTNKTSRIKSIANKVLPYGSKRRNFVKRIYSFVKTRKK